MDNSPHTCASAAADSAASATYASATYLPGYADEKAYDSAAYAIASATDAIHAYPNDAFETDVDAIREDSDITIFLARPLWPEGTPSGIEPFWVRLQADLRTLNVGFEVWIDWYRDRLNGRPLNLDLERKWALLPDEILKLPPAEINTHLQKLRDRCEELSYNNPYDPDPDWAGPSLPEEQEPGLQFAPRADGKIGLKPSGIAPPDDLAEIAAMRGVIIEALDDLTNVLEGSNAYKSIAEVAQRYKSVISTDALSIDQLYAYGVRLENGRARLEREIESGDYPDLAVPAGEALDSVIALHGPIVYSTQRGRELIERARAHEGDTLDITAYKPVAEEVTAAINQAEEAVTKEAREVISEAVHEIAEGVHPERSTQIARTALSNWMIAAAKGFQKAFHPEIVEKYVEDGTKDGIKKLATGAVLGVPAAIGGAAVLACSAAPALWAFFLANAALLHQFAIVAGSDLSWLPAFLDWLECQAAKRKR